MCVFGITINKRRFSELATSFSILSIILASVLISSEGLIAANATPGTGTLYGTEPRHNELYTIDPSTGTATLVGNTVDLVADEFIRLPSLAVDPATGIMYGGGGGCSGSPSSGNLYIVDPSNGNLALVGNSDHGNIVGLDFGPDGTLYAAMNPGFCDPFGGSQLATIDTGTGEATLTSDPFGVNAMGAIAFAPDGTLWGATENVGSSGPALYTISLITGAASFKANILDATGSEPSGGFASIQYACDGILYAGGGRGFDDFGTINPQNGLFTLIANQVGDTIGGLAFDQSCPATAVVGGQIIPINVTSLFLAGAFTNAFWILPTLGGITGAALVLFKIKGKHS